MQMSNLIMILIWFSVMNFFFPKIKGGIKGTHCKDLDGIKMAMATGLRKIPKESFQECTKV